MLEALEPVLDEVIVTRSLSPRATPVDQLAEVARSVFGDDRVSVAHTIPDALELAIARADESATETGGSGAGVLVTGSVVTAAEARMLLAGDDA